jgi:hypothetical protein
MPKSEASPVSNLHPIIVAFIIGALLLGLGLIVMGKLVDISIEQVGSVTSVNNESWASASNSTNKTLTYPYLQSITSVTNKTGGETLGTGNYTYYPIQGKIILTGDSSYYGQNLNVTYKYYAQSSQSTTATNNTIDAVGQFSTWFGIIVVVIMASIILAIVIQRFSGRRTA